MSDLRQTLNQVLAGAKPPAEFLSAVDEYLAQPGANIDALRSLIDAAEQLGLPSDTANAARLRLPESETIDIGDPTALADEDSERTELTTGGAPTRLRADNADPADDSERTVLTHDPDKTVATTEIRRIALDDDATVRTDSDPDATVQAAGGDDPFAMAAAPAKDELGPGSVLKGRFRLEEVIGQGGMGAVYKAVDLLKVEARDRNPYMAVKLLVGDFKEHPEAFIALQRESAKAQRLAHPNIATVYDFDRDGETVYMTMELMVGAELAKYIKKLPAGGLPVPEANKIIEQLCAGLQYAHARGLVHSDFKPGNAFLLDDGTVKLLDFGIARASKTKADAEGESTVFDPGQLGALTPAYATIEMFEGQDPDPRDDIYALACVAYELYTGKHPFNKMSAVKAKEKNLKPVPIAKLNKRQNKTILKALALHRDDRLPSVELFWEGLKPRKDYTLQIAGGSLAAILLIGFLAYQPVMNVIHEREHAAIIAEIDSGDDTRLVAALEQIDALEPESRRAVVAERARGRLFQHFGDRAEAQIDESAGRYDYPGALAQVESLQRYFPRDAEVLQLRQSIEGRRAELVDGIRREFDTLLAERLMPDPDELDLPEALARLRAAQPGIPLLEHPAIATGYAARADEQINRRAWQQADVILTVGLEAAPGAPQLLDRRDRVAGELRREREAALVASLRDQLRTRPQSLAEFRAVREPLQQLGELRPDDPTVRALDAPLRNAVQRGLADATAAQDWAGADALLAEFARTLPVDALVTMRADLTRRQVAAGYAPDRSADLTARAAEIRALLAQPTFDDAFDRALLAQFKEYTARTGADLAEWEAVRSEIARAYIAHAAALTEQERFGIAGTTLDFGVQFHPDFAGFAEQREAVTAADRAYRARQELLARAANIDNLKGQFASRIEAGDPTRARAVFDELRRELPATDPFIRTEGPQALAGAYVALANSAASAAAAIGFADAGLQVVPGHPQLTEIRTRFQRQAARETVVTAAGNLSPQNFNQFRTQFQQARDGLPANEANQFDTQVVTAAANRLSTLDANGNYSEATSLRTSLLQLFPGNQRLTQLNLRAPSQYSPRIRAEIEGARLTRARELLAEGQGAERNHPDLRSVEQQLQQRENQAQELYRQSLEMQQRNDRAGAQRTLAQAMQVWNDNPVFIEANRQFVGTRAPERADDGSRPCTASLAGHGRRGVAVCFDMPGGQRGPELVVIAMPGGTNLAVGKNEVTVADFNHYCQQTEACSARDGGTLPLTGVTIQQADAYIAWLVQATGKEYRLPTDAEWTHLAGGGGDIGNRGDFNCRVVQGGNVVKGQALISATSGTGNAWGIRNAVGNAQEWARTGGTLVARGGSHNDPLTACDVSISRPHSGAADDVTGFRVVRPID